MTKSPACRHCQLKYPMPAFLGSAQRANGIYRRVRRGRPEKEWRVPLRSHTSNIERPGNRQSWQISSATNSRGLTSLLRLARTGFTKCHFFDTSLACHSAETRMAGSPCETKKETKVFSGSDRELLHFLAAAICSTHDNLGDEKSLCFCSNPGR